MLLARAKEITLYVEAMRAIFRHRALMVDLMGACLDYGRALRENITRISTCDQPECIACRMRSGCIALADLLDPQRGVN